MPSFKINNWDLDVNKKKLTVSIKAQNPSTNSYYRKKLTNKDISEGGFKLIDDIDDLYASLTEGSNQCQQAVKLNMTDDGHLSITQKVVQADREKVVNNDIALEKREPKAAFSSKDLKGLLARVAELENQMKELRSSYEMTNEEQADKIKSLEKENTDLKKSAEEGERKKLTGDFKFECNSNVHVSNDGKRAVSKINDNLTVHSTITLTQGVTYYFRIIGNDYLMIGLVPENDRNMDNMYYHKEGAFGYDREGWIHPERNSKMESFKDRDIVGIVVSDNTKVICSVNNKVTYTHSLPFENTNNYLFYFYTRNPSNGVELV